MLKKENDQAFMFDWLKCLGYDQNLNSVRSRLFMLTFHSSNQIQVTVRDAVKTDLDSRTNLLVIEKYGKGSVQQKDYKILFTFSE